MSIQHSFKAFPQDFLSLEPKSLPSYCVFSIGLCPVVCVLHTCFSVVECLFQHMRHNIESTVPSDLIGL